MGSVTSGLRTLLLKAALWPLRFERGKEFYNDLARRLLNHADPAETGQFIARLFADQGSSGHFLATFAALVEYAPLKECAELFDHTLNTISPYALRQESYAQEGEDLVLARIFEKKRDGFYVDVGAHHPIRFSNTYLLYRKGWRGINIDATPDSMEEFRRERPDDINIEALISSGGKSEVFHMFSEPALNTASADIARQRAEEDPRYAVSRTVVLEPRTLASILDDYLPPGRQVDFLNVDVEGCDLDVLQSNNWNKYRPTVVAAELLATTSSDAERKAIAQYLAERNYLIVSHFFNTVFYQIKD